MTAGQWQAYLPEISTRFPNKDSNSDNASLNSQFGKGAASTTAQPESVLLPKGVAITFTYQDMPITWQWALAPQPIPNNSANKKNTPDNSHGNGNGNGNGNSNSNSNSNGASNNDAANGNVDNNSGNGI